MLGVYAVAKLHVYDFVIIGQDCTLNKCIMKLSESDSMMVILDMKMERILDTGESYLCSNCIYLEDDDYYFHKTKDSPEQDRLLSFCGERFPGVHYLNFRNFLKNYICKKVHQPGIKSFLEIRPGIFKIIFLNNDFILTKKIVYGDGNDIIQMIELFSDPDTDLNLWVCKFKTNDYIPDVEFKKVLSGKIYNLKTIDCETGKIYGMNYLLNNRQHKSIPEIMSFNPIHSTCEKFWLRDILISAVAVGK
jgi:hypothetical protein